MQPAASAHTNPAFGVQSSLQAASWEPCTPEANSAPSTHPSAHTALLSSYSSPPTAGNQPLSSLDVGFLSNSRFPPSFVYLLLIPLVHQTDAAEAACLWGSQSDGGWGNSRSAATTGNCCSWFAACNTPGCFVRESLNRAR